MMFNPYQAQRLTKGRVKDAMREAKQARLTRAAKTPRKRWGWRLPVPLILPSPLALFMRPQS